MKHITLFLGIFLLLLAGCQQDDLVPFKDQDKSLKSVPCYDIIGCKEPYISFG